MHNYTYIGIYDDAMVMISFAMSAFHLAGVVTLINVRAEHLP